MKQYTKLGCTAIVAAFMGTMASASTISSDLGDMTNNFASGVIGNVTANDIPNQNANNPGPFDVWYYQGPAWTHEYVIPDGETIVSAKLTLRTYDVEDGGGDENDVEHDGSNYDTRLFGDGMEIAGAFDGVVSYEADPANTISIFELSSDFFDALADGEFTVLVDPQTYANLPDAISIDYSLLEIETISTIDPEPSAVPLPAAGFLLIGAFGGLGLLRRKKSN